MKRLCWLIAIILIAGCTPPQQQVKANKPYEVDILIGQQKGKVLAKAEKIFGEPKQTGNIFEGTAHEVQLRRYKFTNVFDFVMYFHNNIFIQAALMPCESNEYPSLRADYQSINADKPGPVLGYTLFMNDQEVVVDTIQP